MVVTPKMKLNKTIFQVPLTLVLDFQPVKAMQDGREIPVKYRNEKYLIQIEPSKGRVLLLFRKEQTLGREKNKLRTKIQDIERKNEKT